MTLRLLYDTIVYVEGLFIYIFKNIKNEFDFKLYLCYYIDTIKRIGELIMRFSNKGIRVEQRNVSVKTVLDDIADGSIVVKAIKLYLETGDI